MSKTKVVFLFILFFEFSYNQYIVFNFKTNIDLNNINEDNYMKKTMEQKLYVDFNIGDSHQIIPMTLKTDQYPSFIVSSRVPEDDIKIRYNEKLSSTSFQYVSNYLSKNLYALDFTEGYLANDLVTFNSSFVFKNFTFMLATESKITSKNISGEIGLLKDFDCSYPYGDSWKTNFIEQLKNNKLIKDKTFGIAFDSEYEGRLIFGNYLHEIDNTYSEKDISSEHALDRFIDNNKERWGISYNVKCINQSNKEAIYIEEKTYGLILYEIGLIYGSHTFQNNFANYYFELKKCKKSKVSSKPYSFYQYSCESPEQFSDFPDLSFINPGKYEFILPKDDLFKKIGNKYIFQVVFQITHKNIQFWRLGQEFLRKYFLFFKKGEKQSTFSYYIKKEHMKIDSNLSGQIIAIIILSIILALLIILIIIYFYFFYEKKRKKRVQELDDESEYEYIPKDVKNDLLKV